MMLRPQLGAYPDDPYYDPKRPSWLPYWIDTPTESQAKYAWATKYNVTPQEVVHPEQVYTLPNPIAPSAPTGEVLTVPPASGEEAQATVDALLKQQMEAQQAENQRALQQAAANIKQSMQDQCPGKILKQNADGTWACPSSMDTLLIVGAAAIGLVVLLTARK